MALGAELYWSRAETGAVRDGDNVASSEKNSAARRIILRNSRLSPFHTLN